MVFNIFILAVPALEASEGSNPLNSDDATANRYIKDALSKQPNELPEEDEEYLAMLAALNEARSIAHSNQTKVMEKKAASASIPDIQSVKNKSAEERDRLYNRLAEQTGLIVDEVRELFEGSTSNSP